MKIDIEILQKALKKINEAFQTIFQFVCQVCEQIKEVTEKYIEYKLYRAERPVYGYVKHRAMKSQVLNRKPMLIRARTTC